MDTLEKWKDNIGKEVFKRKNNCFYSEECNTDSLNKTEEVAMLFTEDLYNEFKIDYVKYLIKYYSDILIKNSITCNSTNKLSNLQFEWKLEIKQKLIKFYSKLVSSY